MPSITSLALLALYAVAGLAAPYQKRSDGYSEQQCLTVTEAQQVAANYGELIAHYSDALANDVLAENFTDYSESVNTLINSCPQGSAAITLPLLAPTFNNRSSFEIGQGQQPPINFNLLNLWQSCTSVTIRWQTTNTANISDVKPVNGLIVMETVPAPAGSKYPYLIDTVYSEFDAGAWLQNLQEAGICAHAQSSGAPSGSAPPAAATSAPPAPTRDASNHAADAQANKPGDYVAAGIGMSSSSTSAPAAATTSTSTYLSFSTYAAQSWNTTTTGGSAQATGYRA